MTADVPTAAVFLDRDGTLVRDVRHGADPAAFELLPGVEVALQALQRRRYQLVVVSNQSGVARGLFTLAEARAAARYLAGMLQAAGIRLAGYYLCPHHRDGTIPDLARPCGCRKPEPGMLQRAAEDLGVALSRSWMIGDTLADAAAGAAAGARSVLIDTGSESAEDIRSAGVPVARSIAHAVAIALAADGKVANAEAFGMGPMAADELGPRAGRDTRTTGEPSAWPDPLQIVRAEADARGLALIDGLGKRRIR